MSNLVLREDRGGVATLTLNRPDKVNALSNDMFEALEDHLKLIARQNREIGLVVLRGAAGNFSSGYDMKEIASSVRAHPKPHYESEVIEFLANLPQPTIALIEGQCCTGALELALACDLIVAADSARFSEVYSRWGLTPVWGLSIRLPRRVGSARAREIMFTCRTYDGRRAEQINLANFCFPDASLEEELGKLSADILANSWYSNQVCKRVLIETDALPLHEAHALEIFKNEGLAPDAEKRLQAFLTRKQPV
ncbi:MAG TPA: enoyl-CoA hydratase/isomerase family protein [Magnetospirillaceae bacterium]|nr:enoyl-CoA hydratase/isomerase family protein [Magnetospirillaceae bacterium]